MKINLQEIINYLKLSTENIKFINVALDCYNDIYITSVSTDTRTIKSGELFIPLKGDKFDGHKFRDMASNKGSIISLWEISTPLPTTPGIYLLVDDTLKSLQRLATEYRKSLNLKIIAITGSNGKTSTKDYIASVLEQKYNVYKTEGNLNNHIGVPLSILRINSKHQFAVIELGMNHFGEIELLTSICLPDISIITNIGENHLANFGNKFNIGKAKFEILKSMQSGTLLVNYDDEIIKQLLNEYISLSNNTIKVIKYGIDNKDVDFSVKVKSNKSNILTNENENNNIIYFVEYLNKAISTEFQIKQMGIHNVYNSLVAVIIGIIHEIPLNLIQIGLFATEITPMRMQVHKYKNSFIINDAYNASPTSMKAAISMLAELDNNQKKIVLLSDMLELGEESIYYHEEIGNYVLDHNIDLLIAYGEYAKYYTSPFIEKNLSDKSKYYSYDRKQQLIDLLIRELTSGCILLLKGSRKMQLEQFLDYLDNKCLERNDNNTDKDIGREVGKEV